MLMKSNPTLVCLSLLLLLCGCGGNSRPLTTVVAQSQPHVIQRVLILPFANESDENLLGIIATQICQQRFYNHGYQLVNDGDFRVYLQRRQLFVSQLTEVGTLQLFSELARDLQVNTLIKGRVLSAGYENIQGESLPVVTLQLELLNASDGRLLASSFQTGRGDDYRTLMRFGVLRTPVQVLEKMIDTIIDNWHTKGVFQ
jgi:hypothetical protein